VGLPIQDVGGRERRLEMEGRGALELGHTCDSLYEWQRGKSVLHNYPHNGVGT